MTAKQDAWLRDNACMECGQELPEEAYEEWLREELVRIPRETDRLRKLLTGDSLAIRSWYLDYRMNKALMRSLLKGITKLWPPAPTPHTAPFGGVRSD